MKLEKTKADIQIAITLDIERIRGKDVKDRQNKIEGIYGHEQKHVRKVEEMVNQLKPEIMAILEAAERLDYESKDICENAKLKMRGDVQSQVGPVAEAALQHADPKDKGKGSGRDENIGWPKEETPYDPEPGSDITSKGKVLPWDADPAKSRLWRTNLPR